MYEVLLFYKCYTFLDCQLLIMWQSALCNRLNLLGRILISEEGINGTVYGTKKIVIIYLAKDTTVGS